MSVTQRPLALQGEFVIRWLRGTGTAQGVLVSFQVSGGLPMPLWHFLLTDDTRYC